MHLKSIIALAAMATVLPAAAQAQSWSRVGGNDSSVMYLDTTSVRGTGGNLREATVLMVFAKPLSDRVWSAHILYSYDCGAQTYRSLRYKHFGADRELLSDHESTTSDQVRKPDPGAISESMVTQVCTGAGGQKVAEPYADAKTFLGQ